jgi:starvation-inducible DNA-binding protein
MAKFRIKALEKIELDPDRYDREQKSKPAQKPTEKFDPDTENAHNKEDMAKAKVVKNTLTEKFHDAVKDLGLDSYLTKRTIKDLMDETTGEWYFKKVELGKRLRKLWEDIKTKHPDAAAAFAKQKSIKDNQPQGENPVQWLDRGIIARYRVAALQKMNAKFGGKALSPTVITSFKNKRATVNYLDAVRLDAITKTLNIILKEYLKYGLLLKHASWNTKGASFSGLHPLYDSAYEHAVDASDLIAERCVQLGVPAEGSIDLVAAAMLTPYCPVEGFMEFGYVEAVTRKAKELSTLVHGYVEVMTDFDIPTADVLTEVSRQLDKDLWMIEAHIEQVKA